MKCALPLFGTDPRLVGDPIDVVSGANTDRGLDFYLPGPIPLLWYRYYDSSQHRLLRSLGWGHGHFLERSLRFDLDGIRYQGPDGAETVFPFLEFDGKQHAANGLILERVRPDLFRIQERMQPDAEFKFNFYDKPVPLARLVRGNHEIECKYGPDGKLVSVIDSLKRWIEIKRDETARTQTFFLHEQAGKPPRPLLGYRFDETGNLLEAADAYRAAFSFRYDADNRMTAKADRLGYVFRFEYDRNGRCVRSAGQDGVEDVALKFLAGEGVTEVTRGNGGVWRYFHDQKGFLYQIIDPYGGVRLFRSDADGRLAVELDANGNESKAIYDSAGQMIGKADLFGALAPKGVTPSQYGANPLPATALGFEMGKFVSASAIEGPSWKSSSVEAIPPALQRHFNILGRPMPEPGQDAIDAEAQALAGLQPPKRVYDVFGRLLKETHPNRTGKAWGYDKNGNVIAERDWDGAVTRYEYASWNHMVKETDPAGRETRFAYNDGEKILIATDPGGNRIAFEHDLKDRPVRVSHYGEPREAYTYDAADHVAEKRNGAGKLMYSVQRGPGDRIAARKLADGALDQFKYDGKGRCIQAESAVGKQEFDYDESGARKLDLRDGRGTAHEFKGWTLRKTTVLERFETTFSAKGKDVRLIQLPGGKTIKIRRLSNGFIEKALPNGSREWCQFDREGRALAKVASGPERFGREWVRRYVYSNGGDLLEELDSRYGTVGYRYDASHRLISELNPRAEEAAYALDAAGNLLEKPGLWGVSLQPGNRLGTANGDRFLYDENDHLAVRAGAAEETAYRHDALGRLTGISRNGEIWWTAEYDPFGRRIRKTAHGQIWEFFWDADRIAAELTPGGALRVYVYPDTQALTPIAFIDYASAKSDPEVGKAYFVFSNHLGTPNLIEDETGNTVWSARIEAYGQARVETGMSFHMPLRWPGHYWDAETGLHYNRHRYYSPELGRYLESDPIGIEGGLNLYAYTRGNPLKLVDVLGQACPTTGEGEPAKPKLSPDELKAAQDALARAEAAAILLPPSLRSQKTVAADGDITASGFAEKPPRGFTREEGINDAPAMMDYSEKIGHDPQPSPGTDGGVPGQNSATHAEKQLAALHSNEGNEQPIGVNREQCGDCRNFFQKRAQEEGTPQIVSDPVHTRRYNPDGTVDVFDTKTGEHVTSASGPSTVGTNPNSYKGAPW